MYVLSLLAYEAFGQLHFNASLRHESDDGHSYGWTQLPISPVGVPDTDSEGEFLESVAEQLWRHATWLQDVEDGMRRARESALLALRYQTDSHTGIPDDSVSS